ncbi:MAG: hypothetical protein OXC61_10780 [Flavobacteriaceae bacterium]|nr:hypothetical protein [Flavobacteriaceae bacterium]
MSDNRYVFRLHHGKQGEGWFNSSQFTNEQLETIKTESKEVATSIPSPFAQIDLYKSAFKKLIESDLDSSETTAHHRLVSYALDIGELFYLSHTDRLKNLMRVVPWYPKDRFNENSNLSSKAHKRCFDLMNLYWHQDQDANNLGSLYNFSKVKRLYFLVERENGHILGATSPITLFFASPDVVKYRNQFQGIQNYPFFDEDNPRQLQDRSPDYIEYLYSFANQDLFSTYFPEFNKYLEKVKNQLSSEFRRRLTELGDYNPSYCRISSNPNEFCEIHDVFILSVQQQGDDRKKKIQNESDFVINSTRRQPKDSFLPLVLPDKPFQSQWNYTTKGVKWQMKSSINDENHSKEDESILPNASDLYPWLTIHNFLEREIIKIPYTVDNVNFISCGNASVRYLLPIKPLFFKYFTVSDAKRLLSFKIHSSDTVYAELSIPVKNNQNIVFTKRYSKSEKNIHEIYTHVSIFPFFKRKDKELNYYVGILDNRYGENSDYDNDPIICQFYNNGNQLKVLNEGYRNTERSGVLVSKYYNTKSFESIQIQTQQVKGMILPKFSSVNENREIKFAIDFGTTNTHIEYKLQGDSRAFDNAIKLPLWRSLLDRDHHPESDALPFSHEETFFQEMFPHSDVGLKSSSDFKFPVRTALTRNVSEKTSNYQEVILKSNNYLLLEKLDYPKYLELTTDLKWKDSKTGNSDNLIKAFIEFLITIVYYKSLLLGGNPNRTKIVWLYPLSMSHERINTLKKVWSDSYDKVFKEDAVEKNLISVSESLGPYYHYLDQNIGQSLSIDIGGGSTDIAVFNDKEDPEFISSFKFGGNAVFGDGYPLSRYKRKFEQNGFVRLFLDNSEFIEEITRDSLNKKDIIKEILERKESVDFSNYLFSLKYDSESNFDYTVKLSRIPALKPVFLTFLGAILYYSAKTMKNKGSLPPKTIIFSGRASQLIQVIDQNPKKTAFISFVNDIFKSLFENDSIKIDVKQELNFPKEITSKGALNIDEQVDNDIAKVFWIGNTESVLEIDKSTPVSISKIDDNEKNKIIKSITDFYEVLDSVLENSVLWKAKSKKVVEKFKGIRAENLEGYFDKGINSFYSGNDLPIEETLFFYPLIGVLNDLVYYLSEETTKTPLINVRGFLDKINSRIQEMIAPKQ